MSLKPQIGTLSCAALLVAATALSAAAQPPPAVRPAPRPRIEVTPRPPLFRRCTSWYVLQYRPSGTVLFPEKHCWWVRG
jgi:hypothetical protein